MSKQVDIYSLDTSSFYFPEERKIHRKLNKTYIFRRKLKDLKEKKGQSVELLTKIKNHLTYANKRIKHFKEILYSQFNANKGFVRSLVNEDLKKSNVVSVFESVLTRTLKLKENTLSDDLIIVQTYFFQVFEELILNGFIHNNEKYVCFTASAGQIRTKKTLFIKERVLEHYRNSLQCGLTFEEINSQGGSNINKLLAYLALCNSATDEWADFDINKAIVVDDMELPVRSTVDFIDENTYGITRQEMDIMINHTDGCGMILPRKNKKSMMVRLPWIKGLLVPFPYDKFIREENKKAGRQLFGKVKDIYGTEYDLINDGIEVIFTKSQFKMWKYYNWEQYKQNYIKYNCQAGKCNEEESAFPDAKMNYQMLQTLTDLSDDELRSLTESSRKQIVQIGRDKKTMLKVLGVTPSNTKKNAYQQALDIYPELLCDTYSKEVLKQVKKRMVKEGRSGKVDVTGKYTFICPDLYAFCEYLILSEQHPKGLLKNNEVHCGLYESGIKLDCLRSPHLYLEHAIRKNTINKELKRWFVTKGLYTSIHDPISKILMFDVDGDKSLVCSDKTIIQAAERNIKQRDIVPLQYNMKKANAEVVNSTSIYNGLKAAYTGGNIGIVSNNITKIWNSNDINLDVVKWLCMENNYVIDYAKTLYKVTRPDYISKIISKYTKSRVPHFFIYAKDKKQSEVEGLNSSVVNRLTKIIPNTKINFAATDLGKFDYEVLMSDPNIVIDQEVIDTYTKFDLQKRFIEIEPDDDEPSGDNLYEYRLIRNELLKINNNEFYVTDVLVKYLYGIKNSKFKTTLWSCFGDVILGNIQTNLEKVTKCLDCETEFTIIKQRQKRCVSCQNEHVKMMARLRKRTQRNGHAELNNSIM